jgi:hypothetical protein
MGQHNSQHFIFFLFSMSIKIEVLFFAIGLYHICHSGNNELKYNYEVERT